MQSTLFRRNINALHEYQHLFQAFQKRFIRDKTLFEKIANKEIPADIIYEDALCCAFRDMKPCAPVHFLVVPKVCSNLTQLRNMTLQDESLVGHLMHVASQVAIQERLNDGYRLVINDGKDALQSVYHLHVHVMGGLKCKWPPV